MAGWPRRSATRSLDGRRSPASSTTAASSSITTRSSALSDRSRSAARTICSPALTAAVIAGPLSLLFSPPAQLNNLEPFAYLRDVLERMVDGHSASRLDELLPWNWKPAGALH